MAAAVLLALLAAAAHPAAITAGGQSGARGASSSEPPRAQAVPILMYHAIEAAPANARNPSLWVRPAEFRAQVRALRRAGYEGVTLGQAWNAWHHGGRLPRRPVVLSFDDGYASQVRHALPVLRRAGWPGVLNLTLRNLRELGGPRAVRRMVRAGWAVDSHTLTHPDLTTLPDAALERELRESRAQIKRLFGEPARFLCYPSGRYDARVTAAVRRAGYQAATTVSRRSAPLVSTLLLYARPTRHDRQARRGRRYRSRRSTSIAWPMPPATHIDSMP